LRDEAALLEQNEILWKDIALSADASYEALAALLPRRR
jgi:hypothetical protein